MPKLTRKITVSAPIETFFDVIADFKSYPKFQKHVKKVSVDSSDGDERIVTVTMDMMMTVSLTVKFKLSKPSSITWNLIRGDMMKSNKGSWKLKKLSPKKTEAIYTIDVAFGMFVPSAIAGRLMEESLPEMLDAFKRRAEGKAKKK